MASSTCFAPRRTIRVAYFAALDTALPADDSLSQYLECTHRLDQALQAAIARSDDVAVVYPNLYGALQAPETVIKDVLVIEGELSAGRE